MSPRAWLRGALLSSLLVSQAAAQPAPTAQAPSAQTPTPAPTAQPAALATEAQPAPEARADALTLREVLASAERHYPLLQAARQDVAQARGAVQEAEGGFDFAWRTRATLAPLGYYRNRRLDTVVELPTQYWGMRAFAGWRLGDGKFPVYDGKLETNSRGEARAGVFLPIIRGGPIDSRRAALQIASIGVQNAETSVEERRIDAARQAAQRYWAWVAAGQRLTASRTLLVRATERDAGLATRVARGDLSDFERQDNTRAILQRQAQVISAERSLMQAGLALSLFYRNSAGQPINPPPERLPAAFPEPSMPSGAAPDRVAEALGRRPELRRLAQQRRQLGAERDLHSNARLPALDLQVGVSRDMGTGSPTREPTELEASILLDIPLQNRSAGGKLAQAEAKLAKNDADLRLARDRVEIEVRDALNAVEVALKRVDVARRELGLARQLERAERQRFDLGDSSVLFVNLREQATFDAALREIDALAEFQSALAGLRAAMGDLRVAPAQGPGWPREPSAGDAFGGRDTFGGGTPSAGGDAFGGGGRLQRGGTPSARGDAFSEGGRLQRGGTPSAGEYERGATPPLALQGGQGAAGACRRPPSGPPTPPSPPPVVH